MERTEILDAMVDQTKGVKLLSSCETRDFAQATVDVEGHVYLIKLMELGGMTQGERSLESNNPALRC